MSLELAVYVVEDKAVTRATLEDMLERNGLLLAGSSASAERAWADMHNQPPDIALVDIDLAGEMDGIWLGQKLTNELQVPFIFLTAFGDEPTIRRAMVAQPKGYLTKPFKESDLFSAVLVAAQQFTTTPKDTEKQAMESTRMVIDDCLFVKQKNLLVKLRIKDILFIKSDGNYLEIHLSNQKYLIRQKISEFSKLLPVERFLRVHRRFVINLREIEGIGSSHVLIRGQEIPVSQSFRDALKEAIVSL